MTSLEVLSHADQLDRLLSAALLDLQSAREHARQLYTLSEEQHHDKAGQAAQRALHALGTLSVHLLAANQHLEELGPL